MRLSYAYEQMLFHPKWYDWLTILPLLPLSGLYGIGMLVRRKTAKRKRYPVPIVSVGNLIVGGSGKTPFVIALASRYEKVAVISRGYGRKSRGMVEVSRNGKILVDVTQSGDEAMEMAEALPNASVIVSEKRGMAIEKVIAQGAEMIVLDDGFNRVEIEKYEIVLEPAKINNPFPFPAGPYREFAFCKRAADIVAKEGRDFFRKVEYEDLQERMLLVTAISDPERLDAYLPKGVVQKVYLPDHAYFDENELERLMVKCRAKSLLVTGKDAVKMADFKLPLSKMKLKLEIEAAIMQQIDIYKKGYNCEE